MSLIGASPAELEAAAREMDEAAAWVEASARELSGSLGALSWAGSVALAFTDLWSARHKPALTTTAAFLRDQASLLRQQAQQQLDASSSRGSTLTWGSTQGANQPLPPPASDRCTPAQSKAWWDGLSDSQRAWVVANNPDWIRKRDGIPADLRDRLNREALTRETDRLQAEYDDMKERGDKLFGLFTNDDRRAELLDEKLQALDAVRAALETCEGDPPRQLLLLDVHSGPKALAAIASGDVVRADHVAVLVPGMGTTVEGMMVEKVGDAERVLDQSQSLAGGGTVATVTWLGYEAPAGLPSFSSVDDLNKARVGAAALSDFTAGLRIENPDAHLTILAHSYGSAVAGTALADMPAGIVNDAVFYGSPGLGEGSSRLAVAPGHAFVLEAAWDLVADDPSALGVGVALNAEYFGGDPGSDPRLTRLSAAGASGHSAYLAEDSTSMANISAVVANRSDLLVVERPASP